MQKDPFACAYLAKGEGKYEELSVMFARAFGDIVNVPSDDDTMELPTEMLGKEFVPVDDAMPRKDDALMVDWQFVGMDVAAPHEPAGMMVDNLAIVPYIEPLPIQSIPPLDTINISSSSNESSLANWWDYLAVSSDDEGSTATDSSTARSFNFYSSTKRGFGKHSSRYKSHLSPVKPTVHLSSTASNFPLAKPPRK